MDGELTEYKTLVAMILTYREKYDKKQYHIN